MRKVILIGILALLILMPAATAYKDLPELPVEVGFKPTSITGWIFSLLQPFMVEGPLSHPWMCEEPGYPSNPYGYTGAACDGTENHCANFCCNRGDQEACSRLYECINDNDCDEDEICHNNHCKDLDCPSGTVADNHECIYEEGDYDEEGVNHLLIWGVDPDNGDVFYNIGTGDRIPITCNIGASHSGNGWITLNLQPPNSPEQHIQEFVNLNNEIEFYVEPKPNLLGIGDFGKYEFYIVLTDGYYTERYPESGVIELVPPPEEEEEVPPPEEEEEEPPTPPPEEPEKICQDSDKSDYFTPGIVIINGAKYRDYCTKTVLTEYYCKDNNVRSIEIECENGCSNGQCLGAPPSAPEDIPDEPQECGEQPRKTCDGAVWIDFPVCEWDERSCAEPDNCDLDTCEWGEWSECEERKQFRMYTCEDDDCDTLTDWRECRTTQDISAQFDEIPIVIVLLIVGIFFIAILRGAKRI